MNAIASPWLSPREAAAYMGRTKKTAWRTLNFYARLGLIKAGHDGKTFRFRTEDIDSFMFFGAKKMVGK